MENIGSIIKERRKMLSITQRELSDLARVGINTLTKIERDEANPTFDVLQRILTVLGLEIEIKVKTTVYKKPYYAKGFRISPRNAGRRIKRNFPK